MEASTGETTHRWPSFLPDAVHFLYLGRQIAGVRPSTVYVGSLDSLSHTKILDSLSEAQYASGTLVFARNTTLFAQRFDSSSLKLIGDVVPIAGDVSIQTNILRTSFSVSDTEQLVYSSLGLAADIEVIVVDRAGKQLSSLEAAGNYGFLRLSPDGTKLAVATNDAAAGIGSTIWIHDLSSNLRTRFTFGTGMNTNPVWSADGSRIAFTSTRNGGFSVYVKPATGSAEETLVHQSPEDERPESWSSDGRFLVVDARPASRQNTPQVAVIPLTGDRKTTAYLPGTNTNFDGQLSPDGRWLAYVSGEFVQPQVFVSPFPDAKGKWQVSRKWPHAAMATRRPRTVLLPERWHTHGR
jgi:hypothetical protein